MFVAILLITFLFVAVVAGLRLWRDRNAASAVTFGLALAYGLVFSLATARMAGFLPLQTSALTANGLRLIDSSISDRLVMWMCALMVAVNAFVSAAIWRKMRAVVFVAVIVCGFVLAGLSMSLIMHLPPLAALFGTCCAFMAAVGVGLGLTYEQFCMIGNNYVQAGLVWASAAWLCFVALRSVKQQATPASRAAAILATVLLGCYSALATTVVLSYPPPLEAAFHACVQDLRSLAACWHTTYIAVNIIIYVIGFLAATLANGAAAWLIHRRSRPAAAIAVMALHLCVFALIYVLYPM